MEENQDADVGSNGLRVSERRGVNWDSRRSDSGGCDSDTQMRVYESSQKLQFGFVFATRNKAIARLGISTGKFADGHEAAMIACCQGGQLSRVRQSGRAGHKAALPASVRS